MQGNERAHRIAADSAALCVHRIRPRVPLIQLLEYSLDAHLSGCTQSVQRK